MAHTCPNCGCLCHCGGDIDDICFGEADYCRCCEWKDEDVDDDDEWYDDEVGYDGIIK